MMKKINVSYSCISLKLCWLGNVWCRNQTTCTQHVTSLRDQRQHVLNGLIVLTMCWNTYWENLTFSCFPSKHSQLMKNIIKAGGKAVQAGSICLSVKWSSQNSFRNRHLMVLKLMEDSLVNGLLHTLCIYHSMYPWWGIEILTGMGKGSEPLVATNKSKSF